MSDHMLGRIGVVAVAIGLVAAGGWTAETAGSIQGLVMDDQSHPLEGVRITATSASLLRPIEARTAADGRFTIELPDVSLTYEVRFELAGYRGVAHEVDAREMQHAEMEVRLPRVEAAAGKRKESGGSDEAAEPPSETRHDAIVLFNEGVEALKADDLATANARFHAARETDPSFPEPYRALAATAGEAEEWAAAAGYAEKLLEFEPDNVQAMSTVYFGHLMTGNVEAARSAAERLAEASPESLPQILDHGKTFFENNDFPMTRALLEVYTKHEPSQPDPYFALGVSCNALGDPDAARTAFTRFLELAPPDHPDRGTAEEMLEFLK